MNRLGPRVADLTATRIDRELVVLSGKPPGPAGLATLEVAHGAATMAVDVAAPENLVSLTYEVGGPVDRLLDVLLDSRIRGELHEFEYRSGVDQTRRWRVGGTTRRRDAVAFSRYGHLGRIGRLGLVTHELTRLERGEVATGLGLLEAAALAHMVGRDVAPLPHALRLAAAAMERLTDLDGWADDLDVLDRTRLLEVLANLAGPLRQLGPAPAGALDRAIESLRSARFDGDSLAAASLADTRWRPAAMSPVHACRTDMPILRSRLPERQRLDVHVVVDSRLTDLTVTRAELTGDHLLVGGEHAAAAMPDAWLRVFDPDLSPTLVAMAPLRSSDDHRWTARAIVPETTGHDALVDITPTPEDRWRSERTRATEDAISLGQDAARSARLGDPDVAERWQATAEAWMPADKLRSTEAAQLANEARNVLGPQAASEIGPVVTDLAE